MTDQSKHDQMLALVEHFKNDQPVTQDMQSTMMAEEMQLAADALTAALDEIDAKDAEIAKLREGARTRNVVQSPVKTAPATGYRDKWLTTPAAFINAIAEEGSQPMTETDTSREAVERLAKDCDRAQLDHCQETYEAHLHFDCATTLRALLARAEKAEEERDDLLALHGEDMALCNQLESERYAAWNDAIEAAAQCFAPFPELMSRDYQQGVIDANEQFRDAILALINTETKPTPPI